MVADSKLGIYSWWYDGVQKIGHNVVNVKQYNSVLLPIEMCIIRNDDSFARIATYIGVHMYAYFQPKITNQSCAN